MQPPTFILGWFGEVDRLGCRRSTVCRHFQRRKGEPAWPPLALFKALMLAVWYDLSDVKLAEALDDRDPFRRF